MNTALRIFAVLPGILFLTIGARWLITPESVAPEFGMPLLEGLGLSSQIGDLASFFITSGIMILLGVVTLNPTWFYATALLIGLTAVFRLVAWTAHGADFATEQIAVEVIVTAIMLAAALKLGKP